MNAPSRVLLEVRRIASEHAQRVSSRWPEQTRPRLAALLVEAAAVEVRRAAGEDTTTAEIALRNSAAQLAREEMADLQHEARTLALRAAIAIVGGLVS